MTIIRARTYAEAHEYMMLAVGDCAGHGFETRTLRTFREGDRRARTYAVDCPRDGNHWEFTFVTDPRLDDSSDSTALSYGPGQSKLIDAGQWYVVFSFYVNAVRDVQERGCDALPDLDTARAIVDWLDRSRAAIEEILKFLPEGADRVAESALWTDTGREAYRYASDQFDRTTLERIIAGLDAAMQAHVARYDKAR